MRNAMEREGDYNNDTARARASASGPAAVCEAELFGRVVVVPPAEVVPFDGVKDPPGRLLPDCPAFARAPLLRVPLDFGTNPD